MTFRPRTAEDDKLYQCAKFCYEISRPLLEFLPKTRESQATVAKFLSEKLARSTKDFSISADFLVRRVGCTDAHLIGKWRAAPSDLAWLMVHEQLSNYFSKFVI